MDKELIIKVLDEIFDRQIQEGNLPTTIIQNISHTIGMYHGIVDVVNAYCDKEYEKTQNRDAYDFFCEIHDKYKERYDHLMMIQEKHVRHINGIG